jgi:hypothetical protein
MRMEAKLIQLKRQLMSQMEIQNALIEVKSGQIL